MNIPINQLKMYYQLGGAIWQQSVNVMHVLRETHPEVLEYGNRSQIVDCKVFNVYVSIIYVDSKHPQLQSSLDIPFNAYSNDVDACVAYAVGEHLNNKKMLTDVIEKETIWDYIASLVDDSDEWRMAFRYVQEYSDAGENPNDHVDEIKEKLKYYKS